MMNLKVDISKQFESHEYTEFKQSLAKASSENKIALRDGNLLYNKKVSIPNFKSVEEVEKLLNQAKIDALIKYNNIYDNILVSENPEQYKASFNHIVEYISDIDHLLDAIHEFVYQKNLEITTKPVVEIEQGIENNKTRISALISSMKDSVHLEKSKVKQLLDIHKANVHLHSKLQDAQNTTNFDYIIWPYHKNKAVDRVKQRKSSHVSTSTSTKTVKKITPAQKSTIIKSTKKLIVEKMK